MDKFQQRLQHVRLCAEESAQLQASCFKALELEGIENAKDVRKLRFFYEKCVKENASNYPCLSKREEILKGSI